MKKIIAVLAILATVFSLSACKKLGKMDAEERSQYIAEQESEMVEASLKAERDFVNGVNETIDDEIGKTQKGKRLVIEVKDPNSVQYFVFVFNRKQILDHQLTYMFLELPTNYYAMKNYDNDTKDKKLIKHDDASRMLVYKLIHDNEVTYDKLYEMYSKPERIKMGYSIVE